MGRHNGRRSDICFAYPSETIAIGDEFVEVRAVSTKSSLKNTIFVGLMAWLRQDIGWKITLEVQLFHPATTR